MCDGKKIQQQHENWRNGNCEREWERDREKECVECRRHNEEYVSIFQCWLNGIASRAHNTIPNWISISFPYFFFLLFVLRCCQLFYQITVFWSCTSTMCKCMCDTMKEGEIKKPGSAMSTNLQNFAILYMQIVFAHSHIYKNAIKWERITPTYLVLSLSVSHSFWVFTRKTRNGGFSVGVKT